MRINVGTKLAALGAAIALGGFGIGAIGAAEPERPAPRPIVAVAYPQPSTAETPAPDTTDADVRHGCTKDRGDDRERPIRGV